jgi:hypothetical protein
VALAGDDGAGGEGEVDAAADAPAGEVDIDPVEVVEFDPFAVFGEALGVVVDLVEGDDGVVGGGAACKGQESGRREEAEQIHGGGERGDAGRDTTGEGRVPGAT